MGGFSWEGKGRASARVLLSTSGRIVGEEDFQGLSHLTSSNLSWILPGFLGSITEEDPLVQIVIGNTRNILYTRSEKETVGVIDLGKDGQGLERVITITTQKLVEEASRLVTTVETGNINPIVHLAVVPSVEDQMIHLLAVTGGGARLFLTTTTNSTDTRPNTLRFLHVRLPTSAPPQRPVKVQMIVLWVVGSGWQHATGEHCHGGAGYCGDEGLCLGPG